MKKKTRRCFIGPQGRMEAQETRISPSLCEEVTLVAVSEENEFLLEN